MHRPCAACQQTHIQGRKSISRCDCAPAAWRYRNPNVVVVLETRGRTRSISPSLHSSSPEGFRNSTVKEAFSQAMQADVIISLALSRPASGGGLCTSSSANSAPGVLSILSRPAAEGATRPGRSGFCTIAMGTRVSPAGFLRHPQPLIQPVTSPTVDPRVTNGN